MSRHCARGSLRRECPLLRAAPFHPLPDIHALAAVAHRTPLARVSLFVSLIATRAGFYHCDLLVTLLVDTKPTFVRVPVLASVSSAPWHVSPVVNFTVPRSGRWTKVVHLRNPGPAALRIESARLIGDSAFAITPIEGNWTVPERSVAYLLEVAFLAELAPELRAHACLEVVVSGHRFFTTFQASVAEGMRHCACFPRSAHSRSRCGR